jgi:hypothetical protein
LSLDTYEYVGVVVPGTIPVLVGAYLFPDIRSLATLGGIELGTLGLFIIISFIAGHFVHIVAKFFEWLEDLCGVGLKDIPFSKNRGGVSDIQWNRFVAACEHRLRVHSNQFSKRNFNGFRIEIVSLLGVEHTKRMEIFNRTYGLLRGLSAGFFLSCILYIFFSDGASLQNVFILLCAASLMYIRKRQFANLYFQDLVASFVAFDVSSRKVDGSI